MSEEIRTGMSTLSVSPGYNTIEEEFEASLRRAFVDGRADYVVIYSRRQQFQGEAAQHGVDKGWLRSELIEYDDQSSGLRYRLTPEGKKHFGIEKGSHD